MISAPFSSTLRVFGVKVNYYGICIALGIAVCVYVLSRVCKKFSNTLSMDVFYDILPLTFVFAILGARVYYVLLNYNYYSNHFVEIFMLQNGGISIHGAILFGALTIYFLLKRKNLPIVPYFDAIALVLPLGQAIGRFGNYFNQEAFGIPCDFFWCLEVDEAFRPAKYMQFSMFHPTFLYEAICDFIIFIVLTSFLIKNDKLKSGSISLLYLILYSIVRFFIELLRTDATVFIAGFPFPAFVSLLIGFISFVAISKLYLKN